MSDECNNKEIGGLLHSYEIGILSPEENERFEVHLLSCEHCYNQVAQFSDNAAALRSDPTIRKAAEKYSGREGTRESFARKLWSYLWPDSPIIFRPAVLYLLLILVMLPILRVVDFSDNKGVHGIQKVTLKPFRSVLPDDQLPSASASEDILINFVYRSESKADNYLIEIDDSKGETIFSYPEFNGFDRFGSANLVIPSGSIDPGIYYLKVIDKQDDISAIVQPYRFKILP